MCCSFIMTDLRFSVLKLAILLTIARCPGYCTTSRGHENNENVTHKALFGQLEQLVAHSIKELEKFHEISELTQKEIARYKRLLPSLANFKFDGSSQNNAASVHSYTERFTQLGNKEPVNSSLIRNALYSTQPVTDPPQSSVVVDAVEDAKDVVHNASDVATISDDGTRDFFEDELHRMKLEASSLSRLESIKNSSTLLQSEVGRLMTHKPEPRQPIYLKNSNSLTEIERIVHQWTVVARHKCKMENKLEDIYKQCKDAACRDDDTPPTRGSRFYPPNRKELGRAGWLYLHSLAAEFTEKPTELETLKTKAWCYSFASLYPCHICKESLLEIYKALPPITNSRREFLKWTSDVHNRVNVELSYTAFNMTYEELLAKYSRT